MSKRPDKKPTDAKMSEMASGMFEEMELGHARGSAMVGAENLNSAMRKFLLTVFIDDSNVVAKLIDGESPLATFASRMRLLYCLGKITADEFHDLDQIRQIRNRFAHSTGKMTFADESILSRCENLKSCGSFNRAIASTKHPRMSSPLLTATRETRAHINYITSCTILCVNMWFRSSIDKGAEAAKPVVFYDHSDQDLDSVLDTMIRLALEQFEKDRK